jgi:Family of unknown function (DUF5990)
VTRALVRGDTGPVELRIEARDLPGRDCAPADAPTGYPNVHVAAQRRNRPGELLGLVRGDAPSAVWRLECSARRSASGVDVVGPYVQGGPGNRFVYLSWGTVSDAGEFTMFRRAKLMLDAVPRDVLAAAVERGALVGRLGLTDAKGNPLCAAVRPPTITWSAAAASA